MQSPYPNGSSSPKMSEMSVPANQTLTTGDLYPYRITEIVSFDEGIRITWDDGHRSEFHYAWLRDNCQCQRCRHSTTLELILDQSRVPETVAAQEARLMANGE